jgi:steroid delta-isomerase-like uncharacterized protein
MSEENKAVVNRWIEARNTHDLEAFMALFAGDSQDRLRSAFKGMSNSFPDVQITPEEMIAEGNKVVLRWTFKATHLGTFQGIPATGKPITWTGIDIYTVVDGKITALVRESNMLDLLQQLGEADIQGHPSQSLPAHSGPR